MRRSKRVTHQAAREVKDDPDANLKAAEALASLPKASKPVEASPKTAEVLAQDYSDDEDEHVSGGDAAEEYAEVVSDEEPELDAFGEVTRAAVDALQEAVAEPAAFLRPSTNISQLARHAAKVNRTYAYSCCRKMPPSYLSLCKGDVLHGYPDLLKLHLFLQKDICPLFLESFRWMDLASLICSCSQGSMRLLLQK